MSRVTAIITAYNSEEYVCDAIASVLDQSRPVDEIILVDDGSTDASVETARAFAGDRVRIITQANRGAGGARNRGIQAATGDYIAFLDADDIWQREKTAIQLSILESDPSLGLVSGDRDLIDVRSGRTTFRRYHGRSEAYVRREIIVRNCVGNPSMVMMRRSALDEIGHFNEGLPWGQDWDLWIRAAISTRIAFADRPVITYRRHEGSLTLTQGVQARLACLRGIPNNYMNTLPVWRRPAARLRLLSGHLYALAKEEQHAGRRLMVAAGALAIWPFDRFTGKVRRIIDALVGKNARVTAKS